MFIVGHLRGRSTRKVFPIGETISENTMEIIGKWSGTSRHVAQNIYSADGVFPCLTTKSHMQDVPKFAITSTTNERQNGTHSRKLTPKECWRLQGFPDWAFERAKAAGVSDSQLYKQAGNSVTVNVVYEIARRM